MTRDRIAPISQRAGPSDGSRTLNSWSRKMVLGRLDRLTWGRITFVEGDWTRACGGLHDPWAPQVTVTIHDRRFFASMALGGSVGAAEAYMLGYWTCDDLPALVRILVRNASVMFRMQGGTARIRTAALRFYHWLRRNTRRGSQSNIRAHYDLGNDFYALFLDETMTYSCGVFPTATTTLAEASTEKYDRICRKLDVRAGDHLVEIGCGWGGLAVHAASRYGCRVTGTTISREQYDWAVQRVKDMGLSDRVEILRKDYRDLEGTYDKLVSIEMVEAVGHQYLGHFLKRCSRLLKPEGIMVLQAITITDQYYMQHTRTVDFIKRYIFPGSCLVSVTALCQAATQNTDLRAVHLEDISAHYAETLRQWRAAFNRRITQVRDLGFDEAFIRMWDFYFGYCEGAFDEHYIGDVQMVFAKPLFRRAHPFGPYQQGPATGDEVAAS